MNGTMHVSDRMSSGEPWRWPGVIQPGQVINDICSLQDFIPTFAAAAGEPDLVEKVKKGYQIGEKTFKVHLDGDQPAAAFLSGEEDECPREGFGLLDDDGDFLALRVPPVEGGVPSSATKGWACARAVLDVAAPEVLIDLRADPFERGDGKRLLLREMVQRPRLLLISAQTLIAKWLESFEELPPRAEAASFTIDKVVEKLVPEPDSDGQTAPPSHPHRSCVVVPRWLLHRSARLENHIRDNEVRTFGSEFLQVIVSQMSVSMCLDADFTMPRRIACLA